MIKHVKLRWISHVTVFILSKNNYSVLWFCLGIVITWFKLFANDISVCRRLFYSYGKHKSYCWTRVWTTKSAHQTHAKRHTWMAANTRQEHGFKRTLRFNKRMQLKVVKLFALIIWPCFLKSCNCLKCVFEFKRSQLVLHDLFTSAFMEYWVPTRILHYINIWIIHLHTTRNYIMQHLVKRIKLSLTFLKGFYNILLSIWVNIMDVKRNED